MTLYEAGKDALEREFRSLLTRHTKPILPHVILDLLSGGDDDLDIDPQQLRQMDGE